MKKPLLLAVATASLFLATATAFSQGTLGSIDDSNDPSRRDSQDYSFDSMKANSQNRSGAPNELAVGADLVKQQKYADAVPHLELALSKNSRDAIALLYLGFSHRMIGAGLAGDARDGEYKKALGYYEQAVGIDRRNKLLHEYLGKLYLLMRDQPSAQNELNTLEQLCPSGCDERDALTKVMLDYTASTMILSKPPSTPPAH